MLQERELSTARLSPLFALMPTAYVSSCCYVPSSRRCCRNTSSLLRASRLCLRSCPLRMCPHATTYLAQEDAAGMRPLYCAPLASVCARRANRGEAELAFIAALASRLSRLSHLFFSLHCLSIARLSPLFALMPTAYVSSCC
jgi:hypothetical protein